MTTFIDFEGSHSISDEITGIFGALECAFVIVPGYKHGYFNLADILDRDEWCLCWTIPIRVVLLESTLSPVSIAVLPPVDLSFYRHGLAIITFRVVTCLFAKLRADRAEVFLPVWTIHTMHSGRWELEKVVLPKFGATRRSLDRAWCKGHHLVEVLSELILTVG